MTTRSTFSNTMDTRSANFSNLTTWLNNSSVDNAFQCSGIFDEVVSIFGLTLLSSTMIVGGIGNTLVVLTIALQRQLRDKYSHYFIMSLAVADGLVCLTEVPFDVLFWVKFPNWPFAGYVSDIWNSESFLYLQAGVLSLLLISLDRYICVITNPLTYERVVTKTKIKWMITFVWAFSLVIAVVMYFKLTTPPYGVYSFILDNGFYVYFLTAHVVIPFFISIYCCGRIYALARSVLSRIRAESICVSSQAKTSRTFHKKLAKDLRLAKMVAAVLLCFLFVYTPFVTVQFLIISRGGLGNADNDTECIIHRANTSVWLLSHVNCAIDPFISLSMSKALRVGIKRTIWKVTGKKQRDGLTFDGSFFGGSSFVGSPGGQKPSPCNVRVKSQFLEPPKIRSPRTNQSSCQPTPKICRVEVNGNGKHV